MHHASHRVVRKSAFFESTSHCRVLSPIPTLPCARLCTPCSTVRCSRPRRGCAPRRSRAFCVPAAARASTASGYSTIRHSNRGRTHAHFVSYTSGTVPRMPRGRGWPKHGQSVRPGTKFRAPPFSPTPFHHCEEDSHRRTFRPTSRRCASLVTSCSPFPHTRQCASGAGARARRGCV